MFSVFNLFVFALCYLIGSIPFSYLIPKWLNRVDVRKHGSGNTGATNAFRTAGAKTGTISLLGDLLKGLVPASIALHTSGIELACVCGAGSILGHCYSVFLKFKGGKGVATGAGYILATNPLVLLILLGIQAVLYLGTGYMSLASMLSALLYPVLLYVFKAPAVELWTGLFFGLFLVYRHKGNIVRLVNGSESNLYRRAKKTDKTS